MQVVTAFSRTDAEQFRRLKRKKWSRWEFLYRGEWSDDWHHQGRRSFWIAWTEDRRFWAVKEGVRVVAAASTPEEVSLEEVAAAMLLKVYDDGGGSIGAPVAHGEIDFKRFWDLYCAEDAAPDQAAAEPATPARPGAAPEPVQESARPRGRKAAGDKGAAKGKKKPGRKQGG
jgi:hypothetical protein